MSNNEAEVLAFARYLRAVNHVAVAKLELEQAYLTGRDSEVDAAQEKMQQATVALGRVTARGVAEQIARLRGGRTPTVAASGPMELDDDYDQTEPVDVPGEMSDPEPPPGPPVQHRILQGSASAIALCGAAMSASTPNAPDCVECNRVLEARLGMITHRSPNFG